MLAAIPGPGGPGRPRPIAGGTIGPALDPDLVDSLFGSPPPDPLFAADGASRTVRRAIRKTPVPS
jgi:hypothetical protein